MFQVLLPHTSIMSKQWKIVPKLLIQLYPVIKQVLCFSNFLFRELTKHKEIFIDN